MIRRLVALLALVGAVTVIRPIALHVSPPAVHRWLNPSLVVQLFDGMPAQATYTPNVFKRIQTGSVALNSATSNTASISSVDVTQSVLTLTGLTNSGTTNGDVAWAGITLTSATVVTGTRGTSAADAETAYFSVTEYPTGALKSVQYVTPSLASSASATAAISAVTTSKAYVGYLGVYATSGTQALNMRQSGRCTLTSSTVVTGSVGAGDAAIALNVNCVVIESK